MHPAKRTTRDFYLYSLRTLARLPSSVVGQVNNPVFVIGAGRSGSSLLRRLLRTHPEITAYPTEANELWHPALYPWGRSQSHIPPMWYDPKEFTEASLNMWPLYQGDMIRKMFSIHQSFTGNSIFLLKSVMISFMIPKIIELFPTAQFIHIYRDGRAVTLSSAKRRFSKLCEHPDPYQRYGYSVSWTEMLSCCARMWKQTVEELGKQARDDDRVEQRFFHISYERLCIKPLECLNDISFFLGIEPDFKYDVTQINNMNHKYKSELDGQTLRDLVEIMAPALKLYGYEV